MDRRFLLATLLLGLPLHLACGDKDTDDTDGPSGDGGDEDCTLELASAGDVETDPSCEAYVDKLVGMEIEWQWTGSSEWPTYNGVLGSPVVGDVDLDGVPEVVVAAFDHDYMFYGGVLVIIDGATGETENVITVFDEEAEFPDDTYVADGAAPAIGDLDGDGIPEILFATVSGGVSAVHADGTLVFESAATGTLTTYGQIGIADFNGDGQAEFFAGGGIFGSDGGYEEATDLGNGGVTNAPAVGDLDGDGELELVVGAVAFDLDGTVKWDLSKKVPNMAVAIADFDGDGKGEVVGTDYGYSGVWMIDGDGTPLWAEVLPGYYGGPPCVADFDGDGDPEIVAAGLYSASMFEADGTVVWSADLIDGGYGTNGCSAFDFDDDGEFEVVIADDDALMIIEGSTGEVITEHTGHAGLSISGHPLIVDVDGDGRTEMVVGSNQVNDDSGWTGITVVRDTYDSWSPTRQVWNQSTYTVSNINDDLSVPSDDRMSWESGQNDFRANAVYERGTPMAPAANLVAMASDVCVDCSSGLVKFEVAVQVANQGAVDIDEPIAVGVYAVTGDGRRELVTAAAIPEGLAAGRSTDSIEVSGQFATAVGFTHLEVQAGGNEVRLDAGLSSKFAYLECDGADDVVIVEFGCDE